ncbi:MAG TPA: hypothetical protein VHP11_04795 [Tepidisphaeraceae bacterium]|nr:hypothetical protein [Tepidisphaeraceae bacterium]
MPPKLLFDIAGIDLKTVLFGPEEIRHYNPQRGDMEQINGLVYIDTVAHRFIAFKDVRADEFWVPGHVPGRPLMPGVLMIEAAAQAASFYMRKYVGWDGFIGFNGVESCKFRQQVLPGCRLYILTEKAWDRHKRFCCNCQGIVDGNIAFETTIIGSQF